MKNALMMGIAGLALVACSGETATETAAADSSAAAPAVETVEARATSGLGMDAVLAGAWRSDNNKARDAHRHPAETLAFYGVKASDTVVEISPGGGWYTEVIAPYLAAGGGTYIATSGGAERDARFKERFGDEAVFGEIKLGTLGGEGIAPGSVDKVLTFRNIHNWMRAGTEAKVFEDAYAALKPGGVFGVLEHRLPSGREQDPQGGEGYVHEDIAIALGKAAGFEFAGSSDINNNPKDTADHPFGVWTLPPTSFAGNDDNPPPADFDPAKYEAIGESDRFTLKFVKPAKTGSSPADLVEESGAGS